MLSGDYVIVNSLHMLSVFSLRQKDAYMYKEYIVSWELRKVLIIYIFFADNLNLITITAAIITWL